VTIRIGATDPSCGWDDSSLTLPVRRMAGEVEPITAQAAIDPGVFTIPVDYGDEGARRFRAPERDLPRRRTARCRSIVPFAVRPCPVLVLRSSAKVRVGCDKSVAERLGGRGRLRLPAGCLYPSTNRRPTEAQTE
jgi:hypothetical protein